MQIFQAVFLDSERLKIVDMEFEIILTNVFCGMEKAIVAKLNHWK